VSLDGVTWSKALVLTLAAVDATVAKVIHVRAVQDIGVEGERTVMISHSINSVDAYNHPALRDVVVTVDDDDLPGIILTQLEVDPANSQFTTGNPAWRCRI
jgi:hypothetical protein